MSLAGKDMVVKFELLQTITDNFSEAKKVGRGGYGDVYQASYNGEEIAVKKFHQHMALDDKEFDNEVLNLREIQHPNIVRLLGYCYESQHKYVVHEGRTVRAQHIQRLLCFEYMHGGSLDKHISDESCDLDWPTCFKIIRGICEGLCHLHTAKGKPIYHLDLKPANILLEKNMTAKIGDFGLSRLLASTKTHRTEVVKGTEGYMPPEYRNGGAISNKFDVFSLGVIIIKMLVGNKGYDRHGEMSADQFIEFVTEKKSKKKLQGYSSSQETDIKQLKTCVDIALRCVKNERNERPDIKDIVNELELVSNPAYYQSDVCLDMRQTEHRFHLYMTQRAEGTKDSNEKFVFSAPDGFGSIAVDDFTIHDGPAPNANLVGRARGMHVQNCIGDDHWLFCHSIVFADTRFKGSSLKMLGDQVWEDDNEWAIVGGTGEFAYARGAVTAKVIQKYTPATGRIWELRIRAFCLSISDEKAELVETKDELAQTKEQMAAMREATEKKMADMLLMIQTIGLASGVPVQLPAATPALHFTPGQTNMGRRRRKAGSAFDNLEAERPIIAYGDVLLFIVVSVLFAVAATLGPFET